MKNSLPGDLTPVHNRQTDTTKIKGMTENKDIVLSDLVIKKKSLLDNLLVLSIQSMLEIPWQDKVKTKRSELLASLEKNDLAIATREEQTGIKAVNQEAGIFAEIESLMLSIQENNQATLMKLELAEKETELQRSALDRGKKLSRYLHQPPVKKSFHPKKQGRDPKTNVLRGTL